MTYSKIYENGSIKNFHFPKPGETICFYVKEKNLIRYTVFEGIKIFYGGPNGVYVVLEFSGMPPLSKYLFEEIDFPLNIWDYNENNLKEKIKIK